MNALESTGNKKPAKLCAVRVFGLNRITLDKVWCPGPDRIFYFFMFKNK